MTSAGSYETIATFGTSLTDWGGLHGLTEGVLWAPLPAAGNGYSLGFSNGEVYAVVAADLLDAVELQNYAIGGASAIGSYSLLESLEDGFLTYMLKTDIDDPRLQTDINFLAQVDRFVEDSVGEDLTNTTALVQIGSVDYLSFNRLTHETSAKSFNSLVPFVIDAIVTGIETLLDSGVGQIVVNTLPHASTMPFTHKLPKLYSERIDEAVDLHNDLLQAEIAELVAQGANIAVVDMHALTNAVANDPTTFGFVAELSDHILHNNFLGFGSFELLDTYDADQVAFYDSFHPTAAYHGVMGAFEAGSLTHTTAILGTNTLSFEGDDGQDLVLGGETAIEISVFDGDDTVIGGRVDNVIEAEAGRDILSGGSGDDFVSGGSGNDVVAGGDGDDLLDGGEGDDVLIDGLGSDTLYGGLGDDVFLFTDAALLGGVSASDAEIFVGGDGFDTLYLALGEDQRTLYEATGQLSSLGIAVSSIEAIVLVESRLDLALVETETRLAEADLWGLV